jgi:hypothetical protein
MLNYAKQGMKVRVTFPSGCSMAAAIKKFDRRLGTIQECRKNAHGTLGLVKVCFADGSEEWFFADHLKQLTPFELAALL